MSNLRQLYLEFGDSGLSIKWPQIGQMSSATHSKVPLSHCWGLWMQVEFSHPRETGLVRRCVSGTVVSDLVSETGRDLGGFNNDLGTIQAPLL